VDEMILPRNRESAATWLSAQIKELIRREGLGVGDRLPTEHAIAAQYGVSRSSVREAFRLLENEDLVSVIHGRGRFVSAGGDPRVERPVTKYESTTQMLERMGFTVTTAVLSVEVDGATQSESRALGIDESADVIRLTRLRYGDDLPLVFSINTIPREYLPGAIENRDWSGSLAKSLHGHGRRIASSIARISAVNLPEVAAAKYGLEGYGPCLLVTETCITGAGERVVYATEYYRGTEIAFNVLRRP
jgi:GntR family transcriptional regulator